MTMRTLAEMDQEITLLKERLDAGLGPHVELIQAAYDPTGALIEGPHTELVVATTHPLGQSFAEWMAVVSGLPSTVVDPGVARDAPCVRFELGEGHLPLVFQKGISGALNEENQALYCSQGYEDLPLDPADQERLRAFRESAVKCSTPETGTTPSSINEYFACIGGELLDRGL